MLTPVKNALFQAKRLNRLQLFSQLSLLLRAGIPVLRSLEICGRQSGDPALSEAMQAVALEVRAGTRLSQAMQKVPSAFGPLHCNAIQAAEASGTLPRAFDDLACWEEREDRLQRDLQGALMYPGLVAGFSLVGILLLVKFLDPVVRAILSQTTQRPSLPTRILLGFGEVLGTPHLFVLALLALVGMAWLGVSWSRRPGPRRFWERNRNRLPLLGSIFGKAAVVRFCRSLSSLLEAGVPIDRAVDLAGDVCGSRHLSEGVLSSAVGHIRRGETLSQALGRCEEFPPSFHGMVGVGEQSGTLASLLDRMADLFEQEVRVDLQTFVRVLEPVSILAVGFVVLGVLLCAFLPLYDLLAGMEAL